MGELKVIDVTCALIVDSQNRVLAAQRSSTMSLPLKWELPGGKIELNETPEECLVREIKEELDIEIKILKKLQSNTHTYPNIIVNLIPFISKHVSGVISLKEHASYQWLDGNELLDLDWAEADVPILHNYLNTLNAI
ncbi:(deoxy)nucleoside triphosphate pyrophosphohydrolase [Mucilaginibacter flavidus]|uniref:(deoxy)nucleoside triphosphate pyrophosphohydrolase n=1 Tax=Mucilaginibacter flavidus TaxID=2949309 RepID=UPI00209298FC|nr:(deoxy)nucleoside triphosphate pyrophosphohydrolase [Mucilaginibacter flavidus]MCO5950767.1 (deoxy)nucleoside triphosphate pyrophosphohydrolase [Mucilaginibacter flavidus]